MGIASNIVINTIKVYSYLILSSVKLVMQDIANFRKNGWDQCYIFTFCEGFMFLRKHIDVITWVNMNLPPLLLSHVKIKTLTKTAIKL